MVFDWNASALYVISFAMRSVILMDKCIGYQFHFFAMALWYHYFSIVVWLWNYCGCLTLATFCLIDSSFIIDVAMLMDSFGFKVNKFPLLVDNKANPLLRMKFGLHGRIPCLLYLFLKWKNYVYFKGIFSSICREG